MIIKFEIEDEVTMIEVADFTFIKSERKLVCTPMAGLSSVTFHNIDNIQVYSNTGVEL